jgi:hypothetical protein
MLGCVGVCVSVSVPVYVPMCLDTALHEQGDREKEIGLPVSPLMDRSNKGGITRSQVRHSVCCANNVAACTGFALFLLLQKP